MHYIYIYIYIYIYYIHTLTICLVIHSRLSVLSLFPYSLSYCNTGWTANTLCTL